MNINHLKDFIKLKEQANNIDKQIGVLEKITRENLFDLQPLVLPILFNSQYNFYEILSFLHYEENLDLLFNNIDTISELKCNLALHSYLVETKSNKEVLDKLNVKIKNQLENGETINEYFIENLLIYCNFNDLSFLNYIKNIKSDSTCSFVEISFNTHKSTEIFSFSKSEKKSFLNFTISDKLFDLNNTIHLKNILVYINKKGWSSNRDFDRNNKDLLCELLPLSKINILDTINSLQLDLSYTIFMFKTKEDRLRYLEKDKSSYYASFFFDLFNNNNIMSLDDKLEIMDKICDIDISFDRIEPELIYITRYVELKSLSKYPNIVEKLVDNFFTQEKENKTYHSQRNKWVSMHQYEEIKNLCEEITLQTGENVLENYLDCITYHIDITKSPFKQVALRKIKEKNSSLIDKIECLKVLDNFNSTDIDKHFDDIFSVSKIMEFLAINDYYVLRYLDLNQNISNYILDCNNILSSLFNKVVSTNNLNYIKTFISCFEEFSFETSNIVQNWLKENHYLLNDFKEIKYLEFKLKHDIISQEEFDSNIVDLVISNDYLDDLRKIENIDLFFEKNTNLKNEWLVRWTYWKSFEDSKNFISLDNDTYIFDFMIENYLTLFSHSSIIEKIISKPWSSYDDKVSQKQIDFLNKMIEFFGNFEMFNVIKDIAAQFNIKINPKVKEHFYYTENALEDVFSI